MTRHTVIKPVFNDGGGGGLGQTHPPTQRIHTQKQFHTGEMWPNIHPPTPLCHRTDIKNRLDPNAKWKTLRGKKNFIWKDVINREIDFGTNAFANALRSVRNRLYFFFLGDGLYIWGH